MGHEIRGEAKIRSVMPRYILVFDPGTKTGWAVFEDGVLTASGYCSVRALRTGVLSPAEKRVGQLLPPSLEDVPEDALVLGEKPQYRGRGSGENKGTPNDLITLGVLLGEIVGLYRRKVGVVEFATPNEWKGSVSKDICHRRVEKALREGEQLPNNHNARDAVGIGLWRLGRYRR